MTGNTSSNTSQTATGNTAAAVVLRPIATGQDLLDTAFVVLRRDYTEQIRTVLAEHHHPSACWEDFRNLTMGMLAGGVLVDRRADFLGERLVFRATYLKEPGETFLMAVVLGAGEDGEPRRMGAGGKRMAYMLRFERERKGEGRDGPRESRRGESGRDEKRPA